LLKHEDETIDANLRRLFILKYWGQVPQTVHQYFSKGYLFCLYKDPYDPTKLCLIQIPSALCRLIVSPICSYGQSHFAMDIPPPPHPTTPRSASKTG
ncbi:hypothetical protein ACHAWF_007789, partial [Thalassiosira exigua]